MKTSCVYLGPLINLTQLLLEFLSSQGQGKQGGTEENRVSFKMYEWDNNWMAGETV